MTDDTGTDRRSVLRAAGGLPLGAVLSNALADSLARSLTIERRSGTPRSRKRAQDSDASAVFPQGVASGDPTTEGAVLWTRIAPDAYRSDAPLALEVTAGEGFDRFGALWDVETDNLGPERDYTVKVDLDGHLSPDRTYYYRFVYDDVAGPVGQFKTLPAPDTTPDSVRFGVLTCQDYRNGYYGAFHHLATDDIDWIVHLGDFIYESSGSSNYDGRDIELPSGHRVAWGLEDYRHLHRTYRSDRFLQEALASAATITTWDDHEIVNDRYWDYEQGRPYAGENNHPRNDDAEFMTQLFADGIQAWWEYLPVRVRYDPDADHLHDQLRLWRSFQFGDLLTLLVTDERLFRSRPDNDPTVSVSDAALAAPGDADLDHTMLGSAQREWFANTVADNETTWTGWANEVLNMHLDTTFRGRSVMENIAWDGYETERRLLMKYLKSENIDNFVALTGDLHTALAGYIQTDYDEVDDPSERVGVELMTPAVTSANAEEMVQRRDIDIPIPLAKRVVLRNNPHMKFLDSSHHGYAIAEFTPDACDFTVYAVDKSVDSADASRNELVAFRVPAGEATLQRL